MTLCDHQLPRHLCAVCVVATPRQIEALRSVGYEGPSDISPGIATATFAYVTDLRKGEATDAV